ncbi:MAG: molybdopterin-dependent oxidoreductase [Anaerolineae bacterium]
MDRRTFLRLAAGSAVLLFQAACQSFSMPAPGPSATGTAAPAAPSPAGATTGPVQSGAPTIDPNLAHPRLDLPLSMQTTPIEHFYVTTYSDTIPGFDPAMWSFSLDGLVERPLKFTFDELRARPAVELMRTLECIGNPIGGGLISNGAWKGISLKSLLQEAGVKPGAQYLIMDGADEYYTSAPLELGLTDAAMLAYELNGKPLTPEHGRPIRVLLPGLYGQKQPKWVTHIQVADHSEKGYWEKKGWSDTCIIQPNSRIDRPLDDNVLTGKPGDIFTITGIAFTSSPGVARVEVSTDGGKSWQDATLTRAPDPDTGYVWTQWGYDWPLPASGQYTLMSRVTDKAGNTQGDPSRHIFFLAFPNGSNAVETVVVRVQTG